MLEVYGIKGKKKHGKDTFARMVVSFNSEFKIIHFADDLKQMASTIFNIPLEHFNNEEYKEKVFNPIYMDNYLNQMKNFTGLNNIKESGLVAHSVREIMQFFGTDYVRTANPEYWVDKTIEVARSYKKVLIPDVRMVNEGKAIKSNGGKIIQIIRTDIENNDNHSSETEQDLVESDIVIRAKTGEIPQWYCRYIAEGRFAILQQYLSSIGG